MKKPLFCWVAFLFVLLLFLSLMLMWQSGGCLTGVPEYRQPPLCPISI